MSDDDRLKQSFEQLRHEDARKAPSFEAVRKKRPPKVSTLAIVLPVVAAAVIFLVVRAKSTGTAKDMTASAPAPVAAAGKAMNAPAATATSVALDAPRSAVDEAPLDFLLDAPLLRGAPNFDSSLLKGSFR